MRTRGSSGVFSDAEFQPLVILIVSLATYSLVFGRTLTASLAFPLLNYLMLLRDPLKYPEFPPAAHEITY